jgi:hypothetical protein
MATHSLVLNAERGEQKLSLFDVRVVLLCGVCKIFV